MPIYCIPGHSFELAITTESSLGILFKHFRMLETTAMNTTDTTKKDLGPGPAKEHPETKNGQDEGSNGFWGTSKSDWKEFAVK